MNPRCMIRIGAAISERKDSSPRPRCVLDCVVVNLHKMKAIPSTGERIPAIGLGTASGFSRAARTPEECYAR